MIFRIRRKEKAQKAVLENSVVKNESRDFVSLVEKNLLNTSIEEFQDYSQKLWQGLENGSQSIFDAYASVSNFNTILQDYVMRALSGNPDNVSDDDLNQKIIPLQTLFNATSINLAQLVNDSVSIKKVEESSDFNHFFNSYKDATKNLAKIEKIVNKSRDLFEGDEGKVGIINQSSYHILDDAKGRYNQEFSQLVNNSALITLLSKELGSIKKIDSNKYNTMLKPNYSIFLEGVNDVFSKNDLMGKIGDSINIFIDEPAMTNALDLDKVKNLKSSLRDKESDFNSDAYLALSRLAFGLKRVNNPLALEKIGEVNKLRSEIYNKLFKSWKN